MVIDILLVEAVVPRVANAVSPDVIVDVAVVDFVAVVSEVVDGSVFLLVVTVVPAVGVAVELVVVGAVVL